ASHRRAPAGGRGGGSSPTRAPSPQRGTRVAPGTVWLNSGRRRAVVAFSAGCFEGLQSLKIAAVGRALPPHYYDQQTLLGALERRWADRYFNLERLERLHRKVLVGGRHLALPLEEYAGLDTWGKANDAWIRVAQDVGGRAVLDGLARAGLSKDEIDALIFVTVTGVA